MEQKEKEKDLLNLELRNLIKIKEHFKRQNRKEDIFLIKEIIKEIKEELKQK